MDEDELMIEIVDEKNILCKTCFWGQHNFLETYCVKYKLKPSEVYYKNMACPNYKPLK